MREELYTSTVLYPFPKGHKPISIDTNIIYTSIRWLERRAKSRTGHPFGPGTFSPPQRRFPVKMHDQSHLAGQSENSIVSSPYSVRWHLQARFFLRSNRNWLYCWYLLPNYCLERGGTIRIDLGDSQAR